VASICPKQLTDSKAPDFGYRPAISSILDRLGTEPDGGCLQVSLKADESGQVPCVIVEARRVGEPIVSTCNACADAGRRPVSSDHAAAVATAKQDPLYETAQWNCFCEIEQASGADLDACQNQVSDPPVNKETGQPVDAWCYIDAMVSPAVGNPQIVSACPETEQRIIRFSDDGNAKNGSTLFVACLAE